MIQRIQTVYLLIAEMLIGALFFVPLAEIAGKDGHIYRLDIKGIYLEAALKSELIQSGFFLTLLCGVSLVTLLLAIFKYKNRPLQMRLSRIGIIILCGLVGMIYYYAWSIANGISGTFSLKIYFVFPLIASILIYLAIRAINKDEILVRSIDRIR